MALGGGAFWRCLDYEGGVPRNGISACIRDPREILGSFHHGRHKEKVLVLNQKQCWNPHLGSSSSRTVSNKFLSFINYSVCDILLQLPKGLRYILSFNNVITEEKIRCYAHSHVNCMKRQVIIRILKLDLFTQINLKVI